MKCLRDSSKRKKIKNMNSKVTTNSQLLTTEPKKKKNLSKHNHRITEMEIMWRVISRRWGGGEMGKGTGNKKHKW